MDEKTKALGNLICALDAGEREQAYDLACKLRGLVASEGSVTLHAWQVRQLIGAVIALTQ